MGFGWTCANCTYHHCAPGSRCVMCGEPRVTKQQMRDFVRGIPIPGEKGLPPKATSSPPRRASPLALPNPQQRRVNQSPSQQLVSDAFRVEPVEGTMKKPSVGSQPTAVATVDLTTSAESRPISRYACTSNPYARKTPPQSTGDQRPTMLPSTAGATLNLSTGRNRPTSANTTDRATRQKPDGGARDSASIAPDQTGNGEENTFFNPRTAKRPSSASETIVYRPGPVPLDQECSGDWIYPTHPDFPTRQYQLEMTETAIFHNTLVSLPTGLGKTLIGAVVLYNFHRWFPTGKILFMAPTLPLVNQQVKACYDIMGIPAHVTAVLTGKISPERRAEIWHERSVFFCTPETVQRDLAGRRCPADRVCCVVLDEAHRASGDYAYVRVLKHLEEAGAKFRVVALTATPGGNIKAVQKVIDALRINRIDARDDSDESVKQYTHDRHQEVIVVETTSAAKNIGLALNDLIGPILDRLRSAGALGTLTGNATVTPYYILKARDAFREKHPEAGGMVGYFVAAHKFVQLRDLLFKHGVGMVRTKLLDLRAQPQRGPMASMLKQKEFQRLWEEVSNATCDPDLTQATVQDVLATNPKLSKLSEILTEHFERARACSRSSRAIVFSQFRDSVSEIVSVLKASDPLIRPRHFIGQGKGATSKQGRTKGPLKGMKQSEQHEVIRQFREDVYNVLVCTSIGEEGLDIGEVDLIVNFDTLRNPIRMIQRVGRTGRKREGRVVCLVSEGREERTFNSSRQAKRVLRHALTSNQFTCLPTQPMFPSPPQRKLLPMALSQNFRSSQVEGHGVIKPPSRPSVRSSRWRLSDIENAERLGRLGKCSAVFVAAGAEFPDAVRRRLVFARVETTGGSLHMYGSVGRTRRILCQFESDHSKFAERPRHFGRSDETAVARLFPLAEPDRAFGAKEKREVPSHEALAERESNKTSHTSLKVPTETRTEPESTPNRTGSSRKTHLESPIAESVSEAHAGAPLTETEHASYSRAGKERVETSAAYDVFELPTQPDSSSSEEEGEDGASCAATPGAVSTVEGAAVSESFIEPVFADAGPDNLPFDDFRLPTQDSSSSGEDSEDEDMHVVSSARQDRSVPPGRSRNKLPCEETPDSDLVGNTREFDSPGLPQPAMELSVLKRSASQDEPGLPQRPATKKARTVDDELGSREDLQFLSEQSPEIGQSGRSTEMDTTGRRLSTSSFVLNDTQDTPRSAAESDSKGVAAEDIVCSVCSSGVSNDDNPIILCDGPAKGASCDFAAHISCYGVGEELLLHEEWRCDPCRYRYSGGTNALHCCVCSKQGGVLKQQASGDWKHLVCVKAQTQIESRGRLRRKRQKMKGRTLPPKRRPFESVSQNRANFEKSLRRRRRDVYERFLDQEATIDSDEDVDGDEEDEHMLDAIEEDEQFHGSFINDSSQLGYTQDDLDRAGLDEEDETVHRELDLNRERADEFETPALSRRHKKRKEEGKWTETPASASSSEKGLGNMHFIRSVLDHHRQGGRAEEIEELYRKLEEEQGPVDEDNLIPAPPEPTPTVMYYEESDSEDDS